MKTKLSEEEKKQRAEVRKIARLQAKEDLRVKLEREQKEVQTIEIIIEWKRSQTWGFNPHADASVHYKDGGYDFAEGFTASGCGYDKESTVIAAIFNQFLKYKLYKIDAKEQKPYGISLGQYEHQGVKCFSNYYSGGIGTSCYYSISEFIGGKFERIASGKTFDVYKYTDNVS